MQAIQVTVTPVNEAPVAVDDTIALDEGRHGNRVGGQRVERVGQRQ